MKTTNMLKDGWIFSIYKQGQIKVCMLVIPHQSTMYQHPRSTSQLANNFYKSSLKFLIADLKFNNYI